MLGDVLAFHLSVTLCEGCGRGVALKLTPVTEAPLTVTEAVDGENENPARLGATTNEPFLKRVKMYLPELSVVVVPPLVPERVTVADDPLIVPEMLYVGKGVPCGTNTTSTQ